MLLKFTKNRLFFGMLIFGLIVNLLILFNMQYLYFRAIFSFIFLITVPGLLIILMLKIKISDFWENLVYIVGLSIALLMFGGLFLNWFLPLIRINNPLSPLPLLISFDILFLIFWGIAYKRNKEISIKIKLLQMNGHTIVFFFIPIVFLVLSIFGTITLNNQGPNYLSMIALGGIAIYIFLMVLFRKKVDDKIYPWAILILSISLLLMFSLRSWHIPAASDMGHEYYVFQMTKENFHWEMSNWPKNAYNACLSITILPTIFSSFLEISDEYIFKCVFQLIFSLTAVGIYVFSKRYLKSVFALIVAFFFISQVWFLIDMPTLARQEISLFFFTLALLILFNEHSSSMLKELLFLIFGFSMVVSHYTTTYVSIAFFIFIYLICFIFRKSGSKIHSLKIFKNLTLGKKGEFNNRAFYLRGAMVLLLVAFTLFWNVWFTQTTGGLVNVAKETFKNIGKTFSEDLRSPRAYIVDQFNIFYKPKDQEILLNKFAEEATLKYNNNSGANLYVAEKYNDYQLKVKLPQELPLKINSIFTSVIYLLREILKKSVYIFILVGTFFLFFGQRKILAVDMEYKILILGCLVVLAVMAVLPIVTLRYPLERLYQQTLIVLSLPAIFGCSMIFKFLKEKSRINLIIIIFSLYFLFSSGFIPQIVGGQQAMVQLNNFGSMYDSFYTHEEELKSIKWLSDNNNNKNYLIYTDKISRRKLAAFGGIDNTDWTVILPSIIEKDAYVYSNYANTSVGDTQESYEGTYLQYNFPINFLNQNKNLIYNNKGTKVFK